MTGLLALAPPAAVPVAVVPVAVVPVAVSPVAAAGGSVPSLSQHQVLVFLVQLALLLALALGLARLARRFGQPAVVGELLTGVLLGPSVLGWCAPAVSGWLLPPAADQRHLLEAVSQFAVLLMVGVTGSHLDVAMLRRRRGIMARISLGGLVIPLGLGVAAGYLAPRALVGESATRLTFALFCGVALSISAIPVIAKTLTDMRLLHRDVGQLVLGAAAIDDAVGWALLSVVSGMAVGAVGPAHLARTAGGLAVLLVLAFAVGRPVVRGVFRRVARSGDPGTVAVVAVIVILVGGVTAQALDMEAVFGAFVAGVLISGAADQRLLAPLRVVTVSVMAPLFLATAGLKVDLTALTDPGVLGAGLALLALAVLGKFAGAYLGARLSRLSRWEGLAVGAGLNARGAVEVVVASVGLKLGILTTATYTIVVLIAVATSVMAPPLLRRAMHRVEENADERLRAADHAAAPAP